MEGLREGSPSRDGGMGTGMEGGMGEDRARRKDRQRDRTATPRCSMEDGACPCRPHLMGRQCDQVQPGFFCAPLDYYTYEAERATGHSHGHPQLPVSLLGMSLPPPSLGLCMAITVHRAPCMAVTMLHAWLSPCPACGCHRALCTAVPVHGHPSPDPVPAGHHPGGGAPGLPGV